MKKLYFLVFASLIALTVNAQFTLTSSNTTPSIGDTFKYVMVQDPVISYQQGGANQTWDFSSLEGSGTDFESTYITPNNSSDPGSFPDADMAEVAVDAENFLIKSNSEYSFAGHYIDGYARITYDDTREHYLFPMNYSDVHNETFTGEVENFISGQTFQRGGDIEISVDAYGDIILPDTTIKNVVRVMTVLNYSDSWNGTTLFNYVDTIFTWHNAYTNSHLASVSVNYANGSRTILSATYLQKEQVITAIPGNDEINREVSFYPNPANTTLLVNNEGTSQHLTIQDMTGKLLVQREIVKGRHQLDVSDLPTGYYILNFKQEGRSFSQKLLIH